MLDMCNKNRNEQNQLDFCKHNGNHIYWNMILPFAFLGPQGHPFVWALPKLPVPHAHYLGNFFVTRKFHFLRCFKLSENDNFDCKN